MVFNCFIEPASRLYYTKHRDYNTISNYLKYFKKRLYKSFFGAMHPHPFPWFIAQVFIKEEESSTSNTLKLVANPSIVFWGKFLFNLILLFLLEIIIVPLFIILLDFKVSSITIFITVLCLASLGLACATTIIAAMVAKANVKGALFAVLSFPILLPLLIVAISGTQLSLVESNWLVAWSEYIVLFSYMIVMMTLSILLFDFVWEE